MNKKTAAALSVAALLTAVPAMAEVSASASLNNLGYVLYDLNPGDGIAPSLTVFSTVWDRTSVNADVKDSAGGGVAFDTETAPQTFADLQAFASLGRTHGSGMVTGSLNGSNQVAANGAANATLNGVAASFSAQASTTGNLVDKQFALSPYTLLVFTGQGHASATTTVGTNAYGEESASASVLLSIYGVGTFGTGTQFSAGILTANATSTVTGFEWNGQTLVTLYAGQSLNKSENLTASFVNATGGELRGSLMVESKVYGSTPISAVPEPTTWALMFAGIAVVSLCARQRVR